MKQEIIDIIRKFHLTNEIKTYDQCAEEILLLFSVVGRSKQLVCDKCKHQVEHDGEGEWCEKCQTYTYD